MTYNYKDKATNVAQANRYLFAKTLSMFEYEGLPESIPQRELERLLQMHGYAFITEVKGTLYAFHGGLGGEPDVYGRPTEIVITNPALRFNKTLKLETDGVLIENDDMRQGLLPLFEKFNTLLAESDINMVMNGYNTRIMTMITTTDDRMREAADRYLKKIVDGEMGACGEKTLFDGIKLQSSNGGRDVITAMIEYHQYLKGSLYHEIGLDAPINMKRDRLVTTEVELNHDALYPFVDNMMRCRIEGIAKLNEMYGQNVEIDYGSVWKKKQKETVDGLVDTPVENPETPVEVVDLAVEDQVEPDEIQETTETLEETNVTDLIETVVEMVAAETIDILNEVVEETEETEETDNE